MSRSERQKKKEERRQLPADVLFRRDLYDWIQCLLMALIVCVVFFIYFVRVIDVSGTSMLPTLNNGDKMLVSDLFYKAKQGDVVVFRAESYDPNKALVKRVIATGGQTVNIDFQAGVVYVDGQPLEEDYINEPTKTQLQFIGPAEVPEGCVFVLGDNRNASTDSRHSAIGMVDERLILGKVYGVIFPLDGFRLVHGWD